MNFWSPRSTNNITNSSSRMNNLWRFLQQLNSEEMNRLSDLNLKGTERKVLEILLLSSHEKITRHAGFLEMKPSHFYKASSVILHKTYSLYCDNDFELMIFLARKGLDRHLEMTFNKLLPYYEEIGGKELQDFYRFSFRAFSFEGFKGKFIDRIEFLGERLRKMLWDENRDLALSVQVVSRWHRTRVEDISHLSSEEECKFIKKMEKKIDPDQSIQLPFYLNRLKSRYYILFENDRDKALNCLKEALAWQQTHLDNFEEREKESLFLELADLYFEINRFEQALPIYKSRIPNGRRIAENYPFHMLNFLDLLMIRKEFKLANKILDDLIGVKGYLLKRFYVDQFKISFLKLKLMEGSYSEAFDLIHPLSMSIEKDGGDGLRIALRQLETIYFALIKDNHLVTSLLKKNLKFLQRRGKMAGADKDIDFFRLVHALVNNEGEIPDRRNLPEKMVEFQRGKTAVLGRLLYRLRKEYQIAA